MVGCAPMQSLDLIEAATRSAVGGSMKMPQDLCRARRAADLGGSTALTQNQNSLTLGFGLIKVRQSAAPYVI